MASLHDAREVVRNLSTKALGLAEDDKLTTAEKATALDGIEADIKTALAEVQNLERFEEHKARLNEMVGGADNAAGDEKAAPAAEVGDPGLQFVQSAGYKGLKERGFSGKWSSGDVEVKTTLTEGTVASPGPGNAPIATPNVLPGVVDLRFKPLTINDLLPQGTTNTPLIRYLVESAVTNAAATVAEGALKPESALTFAKVDEVLHKIATFLPVSDEMLEDWAQVRSYINARLTLFVQIAEETQLLSGDGTGTNIVGLLNRSGLATTIVKNVGVSPAGDNDMDAIYRQITAIRVTSFLEPDAIVLDPASWQNIVLTKSAQGVYYAGGPFMDSTNPALWGKRAVVSVSMPAGTALVGAFGQGAQVFRKGGLTVEAANTHSDFFQRNLTAIRAEERLALAVYRPGAFGTVSSL